MFALWSIKKKLIFCITLNALIIGTLSISGIIGVNAYRRLVRTISSRAAELPLAQALTVSVEELVGTHKQLRQSRDDASKFSSVVLREQFRTRLLEVEGKLRDYRAQLEMVEPGSGISDNRQEIAAVRRLQRALGEIVTMHKDEDWVFDRLEDDELGVRLAGLQADAAEIPGYFQTRMQDLKGNARVQYHTLIALTWTASVLSVGMLLLLTRFFYSWVVCPLRTVIQGSLRVAQGDYEHRVELPTHDEMADLAAGLNEMTTQFKRVRDNLDRQVRERTKQVVRSEQLASVGFLAAGVAHEINNPLAAIAMCAESLESRLQDIIAADDVKPDDEHNQEITVLRRYLRRIQDEAFRCKGITDKLLNYSRLGDAEKHETDLNAVVLDVIDLLKTLGRYRGKRIEFTEGPPLLAWVVPHEIKQVVLNLVANALDSVAADGVVQIELARSEQLAELLVRDNGCGMSEEVQRHIFEPFFTRRRHGQGTGLGLSITYRIVADHGGTIDAHSDGPDRGSQFRVTLPLHRHDEKRQTAQAA